eukprot:scaffold48_cov311-Pinguiococcus_pyrenoidosus.AAC.213
MAKPIGQLLGAIRRGNSFYPREIKGHRQILIAPKDHLSRRSNGSWQVRGVGRMNAPEPVASLLGARYSNVGEIG